MLIHQFESKVTFNKKIPTQPPTPSARQNLAVYPLLYAEKNHLEQVGRPLDFEALINGFFRFL